jgi:hypothetical protein
MIPKIPKYNPFGTSDNYFPKIPSTPIFVGYPLPDNFPYPGFKKGENPYANDDDDDDDGPFRRYDDDPKGPGGAPASSPMKMEICLDEGREEKPEERPKREHYYTEAISQMPVDKPKPFVFTNEVTS